MLAAIALFCADFAAVWMMTAVVRRWLVQRDILDRPVERSSHQVATPRGGGLALAPVVIMTWGALALAGMALPGTVLVAGVAAILALLSWLDDLRDLPAGLRLIAHIAAATIGIGLSPNLLVFQGLLPPLFDHVGAILLWVWFTNLYNFMDGIDGITGIETLSISLGVAVVAGLTAGSGDSSLLLALSLAAAALAFLFWNWHPAKIFLGDVGSVPLGYLVGYLLLRLAANGLWAPALILPLYYLADSSLTLARRLAAGEAVWRAHRNHFYQRALKPDGDHAAVVRVILGGNVILIALAIAAMHSPFVSVGGALVVTGTVLWRLDRRGGPIVQSV